MYESLRAEFYVKPKRHPSAYFWIIMLALVIITLADEALVILVENLN